MLIKSLGKIIEINQEGIAVILADENVTRSSKACNRVYVIRLGRIVFDGKPADLKQPEEMKKTYFGKTLEG